MSDRHELFDELDACERRWRSTYMTLAEAAAGCRCLDLFADYLATPAGLAYAQRHANVPTYLQDIQREQALARSASLPFNLQTVGSVKNV